MWDVIHPINRRLLDVKLFLVSLINFSINMILHRLFTVSELRFFPKVTYFLLYEMEVRNNLINFIPPSYKVLFMTPHKSVMDRTISLGIIDTQTHF